MIIEVYHFGMRNMGWIFGGIVAIMFAAYLYEVVHYYTGAYFRFTKRPRGRIIRSNGSECENDTYEALRKMEKKRYRFLFGAYISKSDGTTTELDAIAIGPNGIFVIENKDYSGEVIGTEFDKNWSQERPYSYERGERVRWFYNPIMQNDGHIRALKNIIGDKVPIQSLVVFSDRCNLRVPKLTRVDVRVTQVSRAFRAVTELTHNSTFRISDQEIDNLYNKLTMYTKVSRAVKKQHIRNCNSITV